VTAHQVVAALAVLDPITPFDDFRGCGYECILCVAEESATKDGVTHANNCLWVAARRAAAEPSNTEAIFEQLIHLPRFNDLDGVATPNGKYLDRLSVLTIVSHALTAEAEAPTPQAEPRPESSTPGEAAD